MTTAQNSPPVLTNSFLFSFEKHSCFQTIDWSVWQFWWKKTTWVQNTLTGLFMQIHTEDREEAAEKEEARKFSTLSWVISTYIKERSSKSLSMNPLNSDALQASKWINKPRLQTTISSVSVKISFCSDFLHFHINIHCYALHWKIVASVAVLITSIKRN